MAKTTKNKPLITVIVCTYNRVDLLKKCLFSLCRQTAPAEAYQIIVVDNNSSDFTYSLVGQFINDYPQISIRYLLEKKIGLSQARNTGYLHSKTPYVAYIDDDAIASPDWINTALSFIGTHPGVQAFGGQYRRYSLSPIPAWFPPDYGNFTLGGQEKVIQIGTEWLNGTNMIFSRDLLKKYSGFDTSLGMVGDKVSYGEETYLQMELRRHGVFVYYVPSLMVEHLLAEYKYSLVWLLKSAYINGRKRMYTHRLKRNFKTTAGSLILSILKAPGRYLSAGSPFLKRRLYNSLMPIASETGNFVSYLTHV